MKFIHQFLADNWVLFTLPLMVLSVTLALIDLLFDWSPAFIPQHAGAVMTFVLFWFWVYAPTLFNKRRTKNNEKYVY